jgi:hypothetical protein
MHHPAPFSVLAPFLFSLVLLNLFHFIPAINDQMLFLFKAAPFKAGSEDFIGSDLRV